MVLRHLFIVKLYFVNVNLSPSQNQFVYAPRNFVNVLRSPMQHETNLCERSQKTSSFTGEMEMDISALYFKQLWKETNYITLACLATWLLELQSP